MMKANFLLLLFVVVSCVSCKNEQKVSEYDAYGNLIREFTVKEGKFEGPCKVYYRNGDFMTMKYVKGRVEGKAEYFRGGKLLAEIPFEKGEKNGEVIYYYPDGKVAGRVMFKNNKKQGLKSCYFKNNQLAAEFSYKNNKFNGPFKIQTKEGVVLVEGTLKNGLPLNGFFSSTNQNRVTWPPNKQDLYVLKYKDGKMVESKMLEKPLEKEWHFYQDF